MTLAEMQEEISECCSKIGKTLSKVEGMKKDDNPAKGGYKADQNPTGVEPILYKNGGIAGSMNRVFCGFKSKRTIPRNYSSSRC